MSHKEFSFTKFQVEDIRRGHKTLFILPMEELSVEFTGGEITNCPYGKKGSVIQLNYGLGFIQITRITPKKIHDISPKQAWESGVSDSPEYDCIALLEKAWQGAWKNTLYDWELNPSVWVIEFDLLAKEDKKQEPPISLKEIMHCVEQELEGSRAKFPSNKYKLYAFNEECGEVQKAFLDLQDPSKFRNEQLVFDELIQSIATAVRLIQEGDDDFNYLPDYKFFQNFKPTKKAK